MSLFVILLFGAAGNWLNVHARSMSDHQRSKVSMVISSSGDSVEMRGNEEEVYPLDASESNDIASEFGAPADPKEKDAMKKPEEVHKDVESKPKEHPLEKKPEEVQKDVESKPKEHPLEKKPEEVDKEAESKPKVAQVPIPGKVVGKGSEGEKAPGTKGGPKQDKPDQPVIPKQDRPDQPVIRKDQTTASVEPTPKEKHVFHQCREHALHSEWLASAWSDLVQMAENYCAPKFVEVQVEESQGNGYDELPQEALQQAAGPCQSAVQVLQDYIQQNSGDADELIGANQIEDAITEYCKALARGVEQEGGAAGPPNQGPDNRQTGVCFPEDARVLVMQNGIQVSVALKDVAPGDLVAVGSPETHKVWFAPVLTDMHSAAEHVKTNVPYLKIVHERGTLHTTSSHFVATADDGFVPARALSVGSQLLVSDQGSLQRARILRIEAVLKTGMFAPLTFSGTIVVDGVLASTYIIAPLDYVEEGALKRFVAAIGGWNNLHSFTHFVMLPMRLMLRSQAIPSRLLHSWFLPDAANNAINKVSWDVPRYVDVAASAVGSVISGIF